MNKTKKRKNFSYNEKELYERLHALCSNNRRFLNEDRKCYCFYCKNLIDQSEIIEFIDDEKTCICPNCGVDSIIVETEDVIITSQVLDGMNKYWF